MSMSKHGYGYGQSKLLMSKHSQKPITMTTVATKIGGMSCFDEKPPRSGAGMVQKHTSLEEEEEAQVYTVQKHDFPEKVRKEEDAGVYSSHRGGTVQKHGGSAALTRYSMQEQESEDSGDESEDSGDESDGEEEEEEEELAYGHYGTGGAQQYGGYKQEGKRDSEVQKHGYGAIHHHSSVEIGGGYDALYHDDNTVQKHGYGRERKAYVGDVGRNGGLVAQRHDCHEQMAHDVGGYDALVVPRANRKYSYWPYLIIWTPWAKTK